MLGFSSGANHSGIRIEYICKVPLKLPKGTVHGGTDGCQRELSPSAAIGRPAVLNSSHREKINLANRGQVPISHQRLRLVGDSWRSVRGWWESVGQVPSTPSGVFTNRPFDTLNAVLLLLRSHTL